MFRRLLRRQRPPRVPLKTRLRQFRVTVQQRIVRFCLRLIRVILVIIALGFGVWASGWLGFQAGDVTTTYVGVTYTPLLESTIVIATILITIMLLIRLLKHWIR